MYVLSRFVICLFAVLFFASGCSRTPDVDALRVFVEAQEAFEQAEKLPAAEQPEAFRHVAARYQGLVDRGMKSGPIYYNMGNAWFRGDEPGKALAAYLTARRYSPLDPHIASNIQTVLGTPQSLSAGSAEPPTPVIEHLLFWQDWFGVRQKATIAFGLAAVTFLTGSVSLFFRHRRLRRAVWILTTLTLISVLSSGYDWYRFDYLRPALVVTDRAMPRKGNSEQYELSFTTPVPFGTRTTVLDQRGDWLRLRFGDQDGWLPKTDVIEY